MSMYIVSLKSAAVCLALKGIYDPNNAIETPESTLFDLWKLGVLTYLDRSGRIADKTRFQALSHLDQKRFFADESAQAYSRFVLLFRRSAKRGIVLQ